MIDNPAIELASDQRKAQLDESIEYFVVHEGYRIESQSEYSAVVVKGKRPNHVLHLLLTVLTLGLWAFVWLGLVAFGGERRKFIKV